MFRSLLVALTVLMAGSGCVVHSYEDDPGYYDPGFPGDVNLSWSFGGLGCFEAPQIQSVRISIAGEILENDGIYPCSVNGYPGITLHDFAPGAYSYTVEAVGYGGESLYFAGGSFIVDGDVRVGVDLSPRGSPSSYAYVQWSFPENSESYHPSCSQAGVTWVEVSIDGETPVRYACEDGRYAPGVQTAFLAPGTHSIEMWGLSADGYPYYYFQGALQTFSGAPVAADYDFRWNVGGTALRWTFTQGTGPMNCAQAGVQTMAINFMDEDGNFVYGQSGDVQACDAAPIVYNYLLPGTYRVFVSASGPGGVTYLSNAQNPPRVTVRAGQFVDESMALTVQLVRAN